MYDVVSEILMNEDYNRYETSNFAKSGYQSRHNQKYWQEVDYLGLGVSAHSYVDGYRFYNTKRLDTYIDNLEHGKSPIYAKEYIVKETRKNERIMLSLRTSKGLDVAKYKRDFGEDILETRKEKIGFMVDKNLIKVLTGVRRSGKTVLLSQIQDYLLSLDKIQRLLL
jgi:oxygen-independent coproporphyrinogen-3 oxidase